MSTYLSILLFNQVGLPTGAVVTVEYGWEIYMNIYYRASPLDKFHTEGRFEMTSRFMQMNGSPG